MVGKTFIFPLIGALMGMLWVGAWAATYGTVAALGGGAVGVFAGWVLGALFDAADDAVTRATSRWPRWAIGTVGVIEAVLLLSLGAVFLWSVAILMRTMLRGE